MKNRIIKIFATIIFIIFLPIILIEQLLQYPYNPISRIKRIFHTIMFIVNLGHPKTTNINGGH